MAEAVSDEFSASIATPVGAVLVRVEGETGVAIEVEPIPTPPLPEGMAVDGVILVRVRAEREVTRDSPLILRVTADLEGDPESGEWLDSVAYAGRNATVQVAVRDNEWLEAKGVIAEPLAYRRHGFCQTVNSAPAEAILHVSVVWRTTEGEPLADDASAWFAADLALPR